MSYYAGKKHKPRWMAMGLYTVVAFCLLTALPHLLYGPGEDALTLTVEYSSFYKQNSTIETFSNLRLKTLCYTDEIPKNFCESTSGNYAPQVILFLAQVIAGIGGPLYYTLGVSYMDDNISKSKTPILISNFQIFAEHT